MIHKKVKLALSVCGFITLLFFGYKHYSPTPAPNVSFTTITGNTIELKKLQGNPVIVTFWATDCAICIQEIPYFIDLYNQFHTQGLEIIAVAMYYDIPSHVVEMTKSRQLPYPIALDLKAKHALAFGKVELIPSTFLISPSGKIVKQVTGLFDLEEMKQNINQLLKG
jgi:peroxiredoxin